MYFLYIHNHQALNFLIIKLNQICFCHECTTITLCNNTFNRDNTNMANIKAKRQQIMANAMNRFLNFKSMIKIPIAANSTFFTVFTFSKISSITLINSIVIQHKTHFSNQKTNFHRNQKADFQDSLSFVCPQFYKRKCLNVLVGNICSHEQVKEQ